MKRRTRGLGRIFPRGRIYWIQYSFRGKKFWESSGSHKESDAGRLLKKRLGEMGRGQLIGMSAERLTFEQMADMLLNDYRIKERKSIERATSSIKQLRRRFGMARAIDITATVIKDYVRQRKEDTPPAMPATIQKELAALKRMFSLALEEDVLSIMPKFPKIAISNARQGFFESANFDDVVQHLPDRHQSLARFAYMTGWRKNEVTNIEWPQVDLVNGWVRLEPGTTKNDEGRAFPLNPFPDLFDLIKRQREYTDDVQRRTGMIIPWVFHRNGKQIKDFRRAWKKACIAAGVPGMYFHDLRRTAVRNLERAGTSRSAAMKLTGHKTESVYRRYAIVSESDLIEAVQKLSTRHASDSKVKGKVVSLKETVRRQETIV